MAGLALEMDARNALTIESGVGRIILGTLSLAKPHLVMVKPMSRMTCAYRDALVLDLECY